MNTLSSAFSGQFSSVVGSQVDSLLAPGSLFPALLFSGLAAILLGPPLIPHVAIVSHLAELGPEWQLLTFVLAVLTLGGLLSFMNTPLIRFYEGYPWLDTFLGRWLVRRQQRRFSDLENRARALHSLHAARRELPGFRLEETTNRALADESLASLQELRQAFPHTVHHVLPTRLGNTIRKAETYPEREYGIYSIEMWPRLLGVIPRDYHAFLETGDSGLNFMINCAALSGLLSMSLFLTGLAFPSLLVQWPWWLFKVVLFGFLSLVFYDQAVDQAAAWGGVFEATFDLYRLELLEELTGQEPPAAREAERRLWQELSLRMILGEDGAQFALGEYDAEILEKW